jgi:hypothetical protein
MLKTEGENVGDRGRESEGNVLVLFRLLLDVADFLCQLLESVLVVLVFRLKLCMRSH